MALIADVVFDLPVRRSFSYLLPAGCHLTRGQRVRAPLKGQPRLGVVVDLREGEPAGLRPVVAAAEPVAIASEMALRLCTWVAEESLSSLGSTLAALLPPPPPGPGEVVAPPPVSGSAGPIQPEVWMDRGRGERLVERLAEAAGSALIIAPDVAAAGRWARRLQAARLDSGAPPAARRAAWFAAARGRTRALVGTRSALLAPLPPPATLVLLDEHDPAHKPPGAPRLHSRDVLGRRAAVEGSRLLLLSSTPSCETWWQCEQGEIARARVDGGPWPEIVTADTRGILRNHPLTLPLTRTIEAGARRDRPVALIVPRAGAGLACGDCGTVLRCPDCGIALSHPRGAPLATCRLCARAEAVPDTCPGCGSHHLSPFGWSAERVEAAVARRFPRLAVARAAGRAPGGAGVAARLDVVVGTPSLLRTVAPGSLGAVGFISLDALFRVPDFRTGERVFQSLWAAAEAVGPAGRVVVQTVHPDHHAIAAVRDQEHARFYAVEIDTRRDLGYPPFRRLCLVTVRAADRDGGRALAEACAESVRGLRELTVYSPAPVGDASARRPRWQVVIKGPPALPLLVAGPLRDLLEHRRRPEGVVDVEMDPVAFA